MIVGGSETGLFPVMTISESFFSCDVFLFNVFRMTIAAWVSNEAIPGALPVWHP
jgi:hypothetical protein